MRMAPLLLIACGLIYVFKAGIWNLGIDGQFLLASAVIAGIGPELFGSVPDWLLFLLLFAVAAVVGGRVDASCRRCCGRTTASTRSSPR